MHDGCVDLSLFFLPYLLVVFFRGVVFAKMVRAFLQKKPFWYVGNRAGSSPVLATRYKHKESMLDKNVVMLEGLIGDDAKWGKTQDGKEYFTFSLCINGVFKDMADSTERTHSQTFVRIFCYDKKQLAYLRSVDAHRGRRASVFGRLSSYKAEYKGNSYTALSVVCRDVAIISSKKENDDKNEQK